MESKMISNYYKETIIKFSNTLVLFNGKDKNSGKNANDNNNNMLYILYEIYMSCFFLVKKNACLSKSTYFCFNI